MPPITMPNQPGKSWSDFHNLYLSAQSTTTPSEEAESDSYKKWRAANGSVSAVCDELDKLPQQIRETEAYATLIDKLHSYADVLHYWPQTEEDANDVARMNRLEKSLGEVIGKGGLREALCDFHEATDCQYLSNNAVKATSHLCAKLNFMKVGLDKIALDNRKQEIADRTAQVKKVTDAAESLENAIGVYKEASEKLGNQYTADTAAIRKQELAERRRQLEETETKAKERIAANIAKRDDFKRVYVQIADDREDTKRRIEESKAQAETYTENVYNEQNVDKRAEDFSEQAKAVQEKIQYFAQRERMLDLGVLRDDIHECAKAAHPDVEEKYFEKYVDRYYIRGKCQELLNVRTEPRQYAPEVLKKLATQEGRQALIMGDDAALRTLAQKTEHFAQLHESAFTADDRGYTGYVHSLRGRVKSGNEVARLAVEDFLKRNPTGGDFGAELNAPNGPIQTLGANLKTSLINMGGEQAYQALRSALKVRKEEAHNEYVKAMKEQEAIGSKFATQGKFLGYEVKGIEQIKEKVLPNQQKDLELLDQREAETHENEAANEAAIQEDNETCRKIAEEKAEIDKETDKLTNIIGANNTVGKKKELLDGLLNDYRQEITAPVRPFKDTRLEGVQETVEAFYKQRNAHKGSHENSKEYENVVKAMEKVINCNSNGDMETNLTKLEESVDTYLEKKGSRTWGSTLRHVRMGLMRDIKEYCGTVRGTLVGEPEQPSNALQDTDRMIRNNSNQGAIVSMVKGALDAPNVVSAENEPQPELNAVAQAENQVDDEFVMTGL